MAVSDEEAYESALKWLNTTGRPEQLVKEFVPDPDIRTPKPRVLSLAIAADVLHFRDRQPKRQILRLEDLLVLGGVDKILIADFIYTGRRLLESKPDPDKPPEPVGPAVGVLLPLRLETRFYPPEGPNGSWRLRIRIIPDRASMDTHDPEASEGEFESVVRFWSAANGDIDSEQGKDAWRVFAASLGPARAAWLARTFTPAADGAILPPARFRDELSFSALRGLPATLEVWMARGGNPPQQAALLKVDTGIAQLGFPDLEVGEEHWWHSYAKAEAVGLATELDLGPESPDDIDALYVVGLSDVSPDALFLAHRDAGTLGLIAPASPTNTLDGAPAADLGADPEFWRQSVAGQSALGRGAQRVSQALIGNAKLIGTLPGGDADPGPINTSLVRALWPVLWGHMLKDVLGLGAEVHAGGLWAGDNLLPEGPLPAIRVGDQPYGLLPATSLDGWTPAAGDPVAEQAMRASLTRLRDAWSDAAQAAGNVVGADTARLLEIIAQTASANGYAFRVFEPLDALRANYGVYGNSPFELLILRAWWKALVAEIMTYPVAIQRAHLTYGQPQDLLIPLVEPDNLPDGVTLSSLLAEIASLPPALLLSENFRRERLGGKDPNSLLVRLVIHALIVAGAELGREQAGVVGPVLEPMSTAGPGTRLEADLLSAIFPPPDPDSPAAMLLARTQAAVATLADQPVAALERALKAVLDTAIHRIDPWLTAFAWRRLQSMIEKGFAHRLGLYGWVDSPRPGTPGPTAGGLLLAPSANQALTAAILRDKAIHDPQADRWQMNLESKTIRIADRVASEVRLGFHLYEVLGREVERIVGDADRIDALRARYPIRTEHEGRRVCNGQAVLEEDPEVLRAARLALADETLAALTPLRDALDVYGDLLIAEAVHHIVSGRADVAGAAMDAAAGLAAPPNLDVIRTPRSGRSIGTSLLFCLPPAAKEPPANLGATASPTRVADPAVADWIQAQTGAANDAQRWSWEASRVGGDPATVLLDDLGLEPSDTCTLSAGALRRLVLASVEGGVEVLPDAPGDRAHVRARAIIPMLGNRPAVPEDLVAAGGQPPGEADVTLDLLNRLSQLRAVGEALVGELEAAAQGLVDATMRQALANAARWGIVPLEDARRSLRERTSDAAAALRARLDAAPDGTVAKALQAGDLATTIAELAAPDGHYAVLARINLDDVTTSFAPTALDEEWLSVNATVRPILAHLETYQLAALLDGAPAPLSAWSNRPADPWQASEPADPVNGRVPDTRLVAAYGPAGTLDGASGTVAVGLIDTWSEVVPDTDHVATAAFGFDAPGARAPQAILLAVPPAEDAPLDGQTLIDIVAETRKLARARMATPIQLGAFAGALPTAMIPGTGNTGVRLTPHEDTVIK